MSKPWSRIGVSLWAGLLIALPNLAWAQESIESQLAPPASAAPAVAPTTGEQPKTPQPQIEAIDPSPHLPSVPAWIVLATALLVAAPLVILAAHLLRKSSLILPKVSGPSPFALAREQLLALRGLSAETPLAEISTRISLAIREFLTKSKSDSALYQTREEFLTDEERLRHIPDPAKGQTAKLLSELSSLQYAPPSSDPAQVEALIEKGLQTLDALNQPQPTSPAVDD